MPSVALSEHDETFIKKQLETGRYTDASEVVRAGLRLLEDQEEMREQWLAHEIPSRYREALRDPGKTVSLDSASQRFEAKHQAALAKAR